MRNFPTILIFCLIPIVLWWHISRSRLMLRRWAEANGYQILSSQYRVFRRGPFLWNSSKNQTVYWVKTRDRLGYERNGWVRCGSYWWGLWSDQVEVRWESPT